MSVDPNKIHQRLQDALILWNDGRQEGGFLMALITFAAVAKNRYPAKTDRESFEQFYRDSMSPRISVEYRSKCHPVEHILYKYLRCNLVHEGGTPIDIEFQDDGSTSIRAGGAPEFILKIGTGWFDFLVRSARAALAEL